MGNKKMEQTKKQIMHDVKKAVSVLNEHYDINIILSNDSPNFINSEFGILTIENKTFPSKKETDKNKKYKVTIDFNYPTKCALTFLQVNATSIKEAKAWALKAIETQYSKILNINDADSINVDEILT